MISSAQQEGNFQLYIVIDRIISVRIVKKKKNESKINLDSCGTFFFNTTKNGETLAKKDTFKEKGSGEKEYLVKWKHLGYASATWESEHSLFSYEDQSHIKLFERINTTYTFLPFQNIRIKHQTTCSKSDTLLDNESYSYKASINDNLSSPSWKSFVATKMTEDGTYKPSTLQWKMCQDCSMDTNDCYWQLKQGRRLMSHQQDGVKWLCYNTEIQKHNSLLADEMGLGKTCQSITFLEHYIDQLTQATNYGHHALVVVQKSVVDNWRREFEIWAPHLYVYPLCGRKEDRQISQLYELDWICPNTGNVVCLAFLVM
jgi:SNF2 family DNA or RNA helicase